MAEAESVAQPPAPGAEAEIAVDTADQPETDDEALGSDQSVQSASIISSVVDYKYENGRRYHAYRTGEYVLPNDEAEQDRLDLHHHVFRLILDGKLFRAPIIADPQRVLDFGTGTGIWAIDFADEFPMAEVTGTDLSPIQPSWVPPNCRFYVDDVEDDWTFSANEAFDYIHGRAMSGSIRDWHQLYTQCMRHLKPGGWLEMQEFEGWIMSDNNSMENSPNIQTWLERCNEAARIFGKSLNTAATQKQKITDAGFVDVQDDVYKVPIGTWPKDPKLKEIGKYQLEQMCASVEPYTLALLTRVLQWTREECDVLMAGIKRELRDRNNHLYGLFHFVFGRKPESPA